MGDIINFLGHTVSIIFWFVIILIPLVAFHEFGHMLLARLFGIKITEYGIGLPPRTKFFKRKKGIVWSLNWIPLGGFVKIYGDNDAIDEASEQMAKNPKKAREDYVQNRISEVMSARDLRFFLEDSGLDYDEEWQKFESLYYKKEITEEDKVVCDKKQQQLEVLVDWEMDSKITSKETFFGKSYWKKALVVLGGPFFNLLLAWIILVILSNFSAVNIQPFRGNTYDLQQKAVVTNQKLFLTGIAQDSPAQEAGLKEEDEILSYSGVSFEQIDSVEEFSNLVSQNKDQKAQLVYKDAESGEQKTIEIAAKEYDGKYRLGVQMDYTFDAKAKSFWSSFGFGYRTTKYVFNVTYESLKDILKALLPGAEDRSALNYVHGPVAIGGIGPLVFKYGGFGGIFFMIATISVALALFNLLPIPALDGGRLVILTINRFLGRSRKIEGWVINATMILLLGLMVYIAIKDVSFVSALNP